MSILNMEIKTPFYCRCTTVFVSDVGDFSTTASPSLEMTTCTFSFEGGRGTPLPFKAFPLGGRWIAEETAKARRMRGRAMTNET